MIPTYQLPILCASVTGPATATAINSGSIRLVDGLGQLLPTWFLFGLPLRGLGPCRAGRRARSPSAGPAGPVPSQHGRSVPGMPARLRRPGSGGLAGGRGHRSGSPLGAAPPVAGTCSGGASALSAACSNAASSAAAAATAARAASPQPAPK